MPEAQHFVAVNAPSHILNPVKDTVDLRGRKGSLRSRTSNVLSRSRSRGKGEEKRPATAGQFSGSKSRSRNENEGPKRRLSCRRNRSTSNLHATSNSADLPAPPLTRLDCTNVLEDPSMIGVALGSPSQLQPTYPRLLGQSSLTKMNVKGPDLSDDYFEDTANKSKSAKWKKIGGLFKAKNALLDEQAPSPFHQLPGPSASPARTQHPSSLLSRPNDSGPGDQDAKFLFDRILGSNGQLVPQKYAVDRLHHSSAQRPSLQNSFPTSLPLLDVKIPNVQMERYSVMFESLLDKQEPPNLLTRRDKTLNKLVTSSHQSGGPSVGKAGATSNNKDNSYLTPQTNAGYPRRATSPTPSKSPSFSLFPHLPQAAEKIIGPMSSGKQSPLQRSFTAPSRLSPMQESFEFGEDDNSRSKVLETDDKTVASRPQTASTSDSKRISSTPSPQSHASTRSSLNAELLQSIKSLGSLKRKQANSGVFHDHDLEVAPLKPRHVGEHASSEGVRMENEVSIPNRLDMHEDTLAALERPRSIESRNRDISSLKPSKSRIDQIMRGVPAIEPSTEALVKVEKDPVFSERIKSKDDHNGQQNIAVAPVLPVLPENGSSATAMVILHAAALPGKEQQLAARFPGEGKPSLPGHTHTQVRSQALQEPSGHHQSMAQDDSANVYSPQSQSPSRTHPSSTDAQIAKNFLAERQLHSSHQTGNRRPGQTIHTETQSRPSGANLHHRPQPTADHLTSRSPPIASNRSPLNHKLPPENFVVPPRIAFNQMHPPHGPNHYSATGPPTEKEHDNIIDYYLDNGDAKSSSRRPKSPRKLRKRLSDKSKKRLSPSKKSPPKPTSSLTPNLTYNPPSNLTANLKSNLTSVPTSSDGGPRSPIPISKYSVNAVAAQKPLASPSITSNTYMQHYSEPRSPADSVNFSPAVRAAREKAAQLSKASLVEEPPLKQTHSSSSSITKSSSHPRPAQVEFSLIVDAPNTTSNSVAKAETSFYSHSNESTPSLETPSEAQREGLFGSRSIKQNNEPSFPYRSSSRGASLSSLPSGAGVVHPPSTTSKLMPAQPIRSHSAGMVGSGTRTPGIQGHLKAAKGEKVVERHAGLVPTIVDPERHGVVTGGFGHHRTGRSVNLVIESV